MSSADATMSVLGGRKKEEEPYTVVSSMGATRRRFRLFSRPRYRSYLHRTRPLGFTRKGRGLDEYKTPSLRLFPYVVTPDSNRLHRLVLFHDDDDNEEEQHFLPTFSRTCEQNLMRLIYP